MSFRVSLLLTFLLFAAFGGLRPNLATTDGRSSTMPNADSAAIIAYWQTMLPHSTMPSAIRDLLTSNIADTSFYGEGTNENIKPHQPITVFYGRKTLQPITAFYRKGTNEDNKPYQPITAFYGKGTDGDNKPYQPITAFYGKETDGDNKPYQPITAFYGKGTDGHNSPYQPITAFYGKETDEDNKPYQPITAFYGKGTDGDNKPYQPITAFYGKGTDVDNKPYQPITAFYGKGTDGDNKPYQPITAFYGKGTDGDSKPYQPITAFYGKGTNRDNEPYQPITAFYGKGTDVDNKPYQPITAFYRKGTNVPVHVSKMNMADADDHAQEHHHMDGSHDHFGLRNINFLFLEDILTPGSKVAPYIDPVSSRGAPLLPRDVADSIPMSTKSFTDVLKMFAPVSRAMAESIWHSLDVCEHPYPMKGEKRGCVTSIESMISFVTSTLRTSDIRVFSSPSVPVEGRNGSKVYTVMAVRAITSPGDTMVCHGIPFPYKVFLCHALVPTKVYSVTVESDNSEDKEKIEEALVVCHLNTAEFDPMKMPPHVKPGDAPVCHFLNNDDILWAPAATTLGTQGATKDVVIAAQ